MIKEEKMARVISPREKLLEHALRKKFDGNQSELARHVGTSQQNIFNFFTGVVKRPSYLGRVLHALDITAKEYEDASNRTFDTDVPPQYNLMPELVSKRRPKSDISFLQADMLAPPTQPGKPRMIPVLGEAVGGVDGKYIFNGSILDYVSCPPSLDNVREAYAVFVDGESMSPRYRPGETVWVHPHKPPRRGDDVIVQIHPDDEDGSPPYGYIKEFVGWQGSKLVLRQHNPNQQIEFDKVEVVSVHPIVLSGKY